MERKFINNWKISPFTLLIIICFPFLSFCKEPSESMGWVDNDTIPVSIQAIREEKFIILQIQANPGFGIQIDAPNQLQLKPQGNLTLERTQLEWKGTSRKDKPEYYETIQPNYIPAQGSGDLILEGKVFYCDFSKNICVPGKIQRKITGL